MPSYNGKQPEDNQYDWSDLEPHDHYLQIYENDDIFLEKLEGYVSSGIRALESVVVIAMPQTLSALEHRLKAQNIDLDSYQQYIALDVEETLSKFLVNGFPNEELFTQVITSILALARVNGRSVRTFSGMVALLWAQGRHAATVKLEHLWCNLCRIEALPLFCAYPKSYFPNMAAAPIQEILIRHSRIIDPWLDLSKSITRSR
jgi:hypothetical protein